MKNDVDKDNKELGRIREQKMGMLKKMFERDTVSGTKTSMPARTIKVTDATFEEIVKKYPVVVVDCWAPWCGPCRMVEPVIDELASDYEGKIVFGKLNMDSNQKTATKYRIMSIPTILIFKNGALVDQKVGAMPKTMLEAMITMHM